jgi:hypothetical protein
MEEINTNEKRLQMWEKLPVKETNPSTLVDFTLTIFKENVYLFGGFSVEEKKVSNKLWCWNNGLWSSKILIGIPPRRAHSAVRYGNKW